MSLGGWGGGRTANPLHAHCVIGKEMDLSCAGGKEQTFRMSIHLPRILILLAHFLAVVRQISWVMGELKG